MGFLFGKKPEPVRPAPPPPLPEPPPIAEVEGAGEAAKKRVRRRRGFEKTILTGALAPEERGKKSVLG